LKFSSRTTRKNLTIEASHVEIVGDIAFGIGTFTDNINIPSGKRIELPGKWTSVLRRVDANWRIFAHCWNPDLPVSTFTT
jgi:ketosteroid isomerase-like protein